MADTEAEDRSLAPSQKRLVKAREDGRTPLSREVVTFAGLAVMVLLLTMMGPSMALATLTRLQALLGNPYGSLREAGGTALAAFALPVLVILAACAAAGTASVMLQTGFLVHGGALAPNLGRLNPASGLKRILGGANLVEAGKSLVKLVVLGWVLWRVWRTLWPQMGSAASWTAARLFEQLGREMVHVLLLVVGVQGAVAILDLAWTRWRFFQKLRMSREDMKDEAKEEEGDPKVKGRLRQLRHARAKRRMMAAVAKATVVITNPTHYAVALSYDRGTQAAPRVVAKGVDEAAARIRAAADKAGVPIIPNPPLARALYLVPLNREVPEEHFRTVAEIIAYVWRLKSRVQAPRSGGG